jgi:hypothetical protein
LPRDVDRRGVDFVVVRDGKPKFAVECKSGGAAFSPAAAYFSARTDIPVYYQTHLGDQDYLHAATGIRVLPFPRLCQELGLS